MKKYLLIVSSLIFIYTLLSSFFINILTPVDKELIGTYTSKYEKHKYILNLLDDQKSNFIVKMDNKIIYEDTCLYRKIEVLDYRTFPTYNLSFSGCKKMDSNAILERDMFFNILIGNNGSELKRIDPDTLTFYKKI